MTDSIRADNSPAVDLVVDAARAAEIKQEAMHLRSITLDDRRIRDLELILGGGCSPVNGYMGREDYECVLENQHLTNGAFFPKPMTLDLDSDSADAPRRGECLVLRDDEGAMLALLTVRDLWEPDRTREREILDPQGRFAEARRPDERLGRYAIGGGIEGIGRPAHHDYPDLRVTPMALMAEMSARGFTRMLAVDPSLDPTPSAQRRIAAIAKELGALVLLQPIMDAARPTELELHRRIKQFRALLAHYPAGAARLALLPLAPSGSGAREVLWRAFVHRRCGATHALLDPLALGSEEQRLGSDAWSDAARLCREHLGLELLSVDHSRAAFHAPNPRSGVDGGPVEPPVEEEPGQIRARGITCFFTGLSGAGKSTVARALAARLTKLGRTVTLLDGDLVRRHLSSELNFSKEHRDLNIRRIGYVASEITRHGGVAICAPIAPYRVTRAAVRSMIEAEGDFLEIHVSTPLEVCAQRDPKGLYAKAHAGLIKDFTGINDPYEAPEHPEIAIDTSLMGVEAAVALILDELRQRAGIGDLAPGLDEADSAHPQARLRARQGGFYDVG